MDLKSWLRHGNYTHFFNFRRSRHRNYSFFIIPMCATVGSDKSEFDAVLQTLIQLGKGADFLGKLRAEGISIHAPAPVHGAEAAGGVHTGLFSQL